jgi:hypothetical protein
MPKRGCKFFAELDCCFSILQGDPLIPVLPTCGMELHSVTVSGVVRMYSDPCALNPSIFVNSSGLWLLCTVEVERVGHGWSRPVSGLMAQILHSF